MDKRIYLYASYTFEIESIARQDYHTIYSSRNKSNKLAYLKVKAKN